jgi:hypothetical protein
MRPFHPASGCVCLWRQHDVTDCVPSLTLILHTPLSQGDEVAVFAYGGSIMTTIFGHGAIIFDADLVTHSRNNAETVVSYGNSLGHATGHPHSHAPAGAAQQ